MLELPFLVGLAGKALLSGAFSKIAQYGVQGIVEWVDARAKEEGLKFSDEDRARLRSIFVSNSSFWSAFVAQFKTVRRRGVAIVGPSGVGKTSLSNFLCGRPVKPSASTAERSGDAVRFGARYVRVVDTPGSRFHVNLRSETYQFVETSKVDILAILVAYGYLDTIGTRGLRRPGSPEESASLAEYLKTARNEELGWLEEFNNHVKKTRVKIPYCMVIVNKMDHWSANHQHVLDYYRTGAARGHLDRVIDKLCRKGIQPSFHAMHCSYDSFKGEAPMGALSTDTASLALAVIRAEFAVRISEV